MEISLSLPYLAHNGKAQNDLAVLPCEISWGVYRHNNHERCYCRILNLHATYRLLEISQVIYKYLSFSISLSSQTFPCEQSVPSGSSVTNSKLFILHG